MMRGAVRIVAEADRGGTRLVALRGEGPLLPRRTGPGTVHLVGGAAGPLGGDRLRIEIEVGPGAELTVRTVAASIALPGRGGAVSRVDVTARVAAGAYLAFLPEPLIAAAGCRHEVTTAVDLEAGAGLLWRDEVVCGRHGEPAGDVTLRASVRLAGRPLYRNDLAIGPSAPGWSGGAVLGGARAHASLLQVNGHDGAATTDAVEPPRLLGPTAALLPLAGPATVALVTGPDLRQVRAALDPLLHAQHVIRPRSPRSAAVAG
jgi:urease accessory protein